MSDSFPRTLFLCFVTGDERAPGDLTSHRKSPLVPNGRPIVRTDRGPTRPLFRVNRVGQDTDGSFLQSSRASQVVQVERCHRRTGVPLFIKLSRTTQIRRITQWKESSRTQPLSKVMVLIIIIIVVDHQWPVCSTFHEVSLEYAKCGNRLLLWLRASSICGLDSGVSTIYHLGTRFGSERLEIRVRESWYGVEFRSIGPPVLGRLGRRVAKTREDPRSVGPSEVSDERQPKSKKSDDEKSAQWLLFCRIILVTKI